MKIFISISVVIFIFGCRGIPLSGFLFGGKSPSAKVLQREGFKGKGFPEGKVSLRRGKGPIKSTYNIRKGALKKYQ